ncbi:tRNA-uridine aminocarboxypropyltransferase [Litorilituus lipolyticus]|uniref:tRNA-uridine aminocarboxypropyltransferase n=1 Tax=Litorilituus lipolyticus TaxID=2491017 RepID=A0A502KXU2_9GAMM|nr:tRNA-uridine aminocarboxypropyltransferase [Litorilituus lipolyticus]TPH16412.1 DTW domain-containing protein [Litorilituus lipolyticus]
MTRAICQHCLRPSKACICQFITPLNNKIHVVILQHPSEEKQTKGTVTLLSSSLNQCQTIVGESFTENEAFLAVLKRFHCFLLYPGEQVETLSVEPLTKSNESDKPLCMVILDGTWKKVYRMLQLNQTLQQLPRLQLPEALASSGKYIIRKVAKNNALSSLEACCFALALLEEHEVSTKKEMSVIESSQYQKLLDKFDEFNHFQLSFVPKAHQS